MFQERDGKEVKKMCENCPYHYKTEDDSFPCCHFEGPDGWAPCEYEEEYEEEEEEYEEEEEDD